MGKGKKSKKSSRHTSKTRHDDEEAGDNVGSITSKAPQPLMIGLLAMELIFGIVFIIIGAMNVNKCNIEPMIPIWLILMGIIYLITGVHEYNQYRIARSKPHQGRGVVSLVITAIVATTTVALFIAGNVFVYRAWGVTPDYGHYWFSNGCNMSAYMLSFVAIIVMDAMFGLILLGILVYAAFTCFCGAK